MNLPADIKHTEKMLREAMELLEEVYPQAAMFQRHRYAVLRKRFDQHVEINDELHKALNGIDVC